MEYIIYSATLALLECENVTILGLHRMLTDDLYLNWVLRQVKDPSVRRFFEHEYLQWDRSFRHEAVTSILNKTGQIILAPIIRNVVGQVMRKIDARFMMDHQRILIANLSKGTLGDDKASVLGSLLVNGFAHAAMSRANVPQHERVPFTLIVDEFTSFGSDIFASILSETRKYGLRLVLATQFLDSVNERVLPAVIGNVGNILSFRVGHSDATILEREFGDSYNAHTFSSRPNFEVAARLLDRGVHHEPFLGTVEPYPYRAYGTRDRVIARSREKYGTPRAVAESRIERWFARGTQQSIKRRRGSQWKRRAV